MSDMQSFLIYCIELYASNNNISGKEAYNIFERNNIYAYIHDTYEALHTISDEMILDDIAALLGEKRRKAV
ncbi:hypothetical protein FACS1894200_05460 [Spirochaetia bacterium]|nr:hypothetical protein FACS1894200_05460 [Spirochaetia bacterium]